MPEKRLFGVCGSDFIIRKEIVERYAEYFTDGIELIQINMPESCLDLCNRAPREVIAVHLKSCGELILCEHALLPQSADPLSDKSVV